MRRRRQPAFYTVPSPAPISELNTTPLIDVMLVLLIMFILSVPKITHKVAIDLPSGPVTNTQPNISRLELDAAGQLRWNNAPLERAALPARPAGVRKDPAGVLHLSASAETRYEDYDIVLAAVRTAGIERLGLVDNARFASDLDR